MFTEAAKMLREYDKLKSGDLKLPTLPDHLGYRRALPLIWSSASGSRPYRLKPAGVPELSVLLIEFDNR